LIGRCIFGDSKFVIKRKKEDYCYFFTYPKGDPKINSQTEPSDISTMTQEEREDIFHQME